MSLSNSRENSTKEEGGSIPFLQQSESGKFLPEEENHYSLTSFFSSHPLYSSSLDQEPGVASSSPATGFSVFSSHGESHAVVDAMVTKAWRGGTLYPQKKDLMHEKDEIDPAPYAAIVQSPCCTKSASRSSLLNSTVTTTPRSNSHSNANLNHSGNSSLLFSSSSTQPLSTTQLFQELENESKRRQAARLSQDYDMLIQHRARPTMMMASIAKGLTSTSSLSLSSTNSATPGSSSSPNSSFVSRPICLVSDIKKGSRHWNRISSLSSTHFRCDEQSSSKKNLPESSESNVLAHPRRRSYSAIVPPPVFGFPSCSTSEEGIPFAHPQKYHYSPSHSSSSSLVLASLQEQSSLESSVDIPYPAFPSTLSRPPLLREEYSLTSRHSSRRSESTSCSMHRPVVSPASTALDKVKAALIPTDRDSLVRDSDRVHTMKENASKKRSGWSIALPEGKSKEESTSGFPVSEEENVQSSYDDWNSPIPQKATPSLSHDSGNIEEKAGVIKQRRVSPSPIPAPPPGMETSFDSRFDAPSRPQGRTSMEGHKESPYSPPPFQMKKRKKNSLSSYLFPCSKPISLLEDSESLALLGVPRDSLEELLSDPFFEVTSEENSYRLVVMEEEYQARKEWTSYFQVAKKEKSECQTEGLKQKYTYSAECNSISPPPSQIEKGTREDEVPPSYTLAGLSSSLSPLSFQGALEGSRNCGCSRDSAGMALHFSSSCSPSIPLSCIPPESAIIPSSTLVELDPTAAESDLTFGMAEGLLNVENTTHEKRKTENGPKHSLQRSSERQSSDSSSTKRSKDFRSRKSGSMNRRTTPKSAVSASPATLRLSRAKDGVVAKVEAKQDLGRMTSRNRSKPREKNSKARKAKISKSVLAEKGEKIGQAKKRGEEIVGQNIDDHPLQGELTVPISTLISKSTGVVVEKERLQKDEKDSLAKEERKEKEPVASPLSSPLSLFTIPPSSVDAVQNEDSFPDRRPEVSMEQKSKTCGIASLVVPTPVGYQREEQERELETTVGTVTSVVTVVAEPPIDITPTTIPLPTTSEDEVPSRGKKKRKEEEKVMEEKTKTRVGVIGAVNGRSTKVILTETGSAKMRKSTISIVESIEKEDAEEEKKKQHATPKENKIGVQGKSRRVGLPSSTPISRREEKGHTVVDSVASSFISLLLPSDASGSMEPVASVAGWSSEISREACSTREGEEKKTIPSSIELVPVAGKEPHDEGKLVPRSVLFNETKTRTSAVSTEEKCSSSTRVNKVIEEQEDKNNIEGTPAVNVREEVEKPSSVGGIFMGNSDELNVSAREENEETWTNGPVVPVTEGIDHFSSSPVLRSEDPLPFSKVSPPSCSSMMSEKVKEVGREESPSTVPLEEDSSRETHPLLAARSSDTGGARLRGSPPRRSVSPTSLLTLGPHPSVSPTSHAHQVFPPNLPLLMVGDRVTSQARSTTTSVQEPFPSSSAVAEVTSEEEMAPLLSAFQSVIQGAPEHGNEIEEYLRFSLPFLPAAGSTSTTPPASLWETQKEEATEKEKASIPIRFPVSTMTSSNSSTSSSKSNLDGNEASSTQQQKMVRKRRSEYLKSLRQKTRLIRLLPLSSSRREGGTSKGGEEDEEEPEHEDSVDDLVLGDTDYHHQNVQFILDLFGELWMTKEEISSLRSAGRLGSRSKERKGANPVLPPRDKKSTSPSTESARETTPTLEEEKVEKMNPASAFYSIQALGVLFENQNAMED